MAAKAPPAAMRKICLAAGRMLAVTSQVPAGLADPGARGSGFCELSIWLGDRDDARLQAAIEPLTPGIRNAKLLLPRYLGIRNLAERTAGRFAAAGAG